MGLHVKIAFAHALSGMDDARQRLVNGAHQRPGHQHTNGKQQHKASGPAHRALRRAAAAWRKAASRWASCTWGEGIKALEERSNTRHQLLVAPESRRCPGVGSGIFFSSSSTLLRLGLFCASACLLGIRLGVGRDAFLQLGRGDRASFLRLRAVGLWGHRRPPGWRPACVRYSYRQCRATARHR